MSKDVNIELQLLSILLEKHPRRIPLTQAFNTLYQTQKWAFKPVTEAGGPAPFIENSCSLLALDRKDTVVMVKPHIPFVICREENCSCCMLHVCQHWPSRVTSCKSCKADVLKSPYNVKVSKRFPILLDISPNVLMKLMKLGKFVIRASTPILYEKCALKGDPLSFPHLCRYYNSESGCNRAHCLFFHLCQRYIQGKCFKLTCKLSHDFSSVHNKKVVDICGGIPMSPLEIKQVLKAETTVTKLAAELMSRDFRILDTATNICVWNLVGRCGTGESCPLQHVNMPFWWQYQGDEKTWQSWDIDTILILEKAFCNPIIKTVEIKLKDLPVIIDFTSMTILNGLYKLRRMSTTSYYDTTYVGKLGTYYHWYWEERDDIWHEFPSCVTQGKENPQLELPSHVIETAFLSGREELRFTISGSDFILYFHGMQMRELGRKCTRSIARRPVYRHISKCAMLSMGKDDPTDDYYTDSTDINSNSEEWNDVCVLLNKTPQNIIKLVSNLTKIRFDRFRGLKKILTLFHPFDGTHTVEAIIQNGLTESPEIIKTYGEGVHLTKKLNYNEHLRYDSVIIADVALGDRIVRANKCDKKLPKDRFGHIADYCVDNVDNPEVFVIYNLNSIMPRYIVHL